MPRGIIVFLSKGENSLLYKQFWKIWIDTKKIFKDSNITPLLSLWLDETWPLTPVMDFDELMNFMNNDHFYNFVLGVNQL